MRKYEVRDFGGVALKLGGRHCRGEMGGVGGWRKHWLPVKSHNRALEEGRVACGRGDERQKRSTQDQPGIGKKVRRHNRRTSETSTRGFLIMKDGQRSLKNEKERSPLQGE